MRTVELAGATFCYDTAGDGHDETVLLLHGGRGVGDHRGELNAYRPLADRYRVLAYDQRGCGRTSLTPPFTFERLADDVEAFRERFCPGRRIVLLGGSFGGMIALTYAVKYPHGLSRLILRGTAPSQFGEAEAIENFKARLHRAPSASLRMVERILSDGIVDDTELRLIWLALQPLYYEQFDADAALERTRTLSVHADTHNALFRDVTYDLRGRLGEIVVPTLVVVGAQDWICPPSQSRIIAASVPRAELLEVPQAGHSVHIECNAEVLEAVRAFLSRTAG